MELNRAPEISIIIVTYRREEMVCEAVELLLPMLGLFSEIIVIDQSPKQNEVLAQNSQVRYYGNRYPNMVEARNYGIQKANGGILLFLDDDVIPLPGLLESHLSAYTDSSIGGVAGRILEQNSDPEQSIDERFFDLVDGWRYADFAGTNFRDDVMTVRGCNMSFRRNLLIELGGFDTHFRSFRDDSEISFRVRKAGHRIVFEPAACLIHKSAQYGGTRMTNKARSPIKAELLLYRQHFRHYRDNLYFLVKHFSGWQRCYWIIDAYFTYVGLSRWPWRLFAKNTCFLIALVQAAIWTSVDRPPYFDKT